MPSDKLLPNLWLLTIRNVCYPAFVCLVLFPLNCTLNCWLCLTRCGWGLKAGDQGYPHQLRSQPFGLRSSSLWSQEVRWSRCPRQIPEILPINILRIPGWLWRILCTCYVEKIWQAKISHTCVVWIDLFPSFLFMFTETWWRRKMGIENDKVHIFRRKRESMKYREFW